MRENKAIHLRNLGEDELERPVEAGEANALPGHASALGRAPATSVTSKKAWSATCRCTVESLSLLRAWLGRFIPHLS